MNSLLSSSPPGHWVNFYQTLHKAFLGEDEEDSSSLSNEEHFQKEINHINEKTKLHKQNLEIFPRTTVQIFNQTRTLSILG